jgi:hypothetical protein
MGEIMYRIERMAGATQPGWSAADIDRECSELASRFIQRSIYPPLEIMQRNWEQR